MDAIRALSVLVTVVDEGSFAAAARAMRMSPPSVTRLVAELEAELGVVLLHRSTRRIALTDVGRAYVNDARKLLADFEAANDAARGAHQAPTGLLRVTAPTLFGQMHVTPILTEYLDLYPDVRVEAIFVDRVVDLVAEGIDVAVRIAHLPDSPLIASRVGKVRPMVCGCPSYLERRGAPRTPQELSSHNLIVADFARHEWRFADGVVLPLQPRLVFATIPAALEAAKSGWGLTRALSYQVNPHVESGCLEEVLSEHAPKPVPIHVVHAENRHSAAKVRAFVDLAVRRMRENRFLDEH